MSAITTFFSELRRDEDGASFLEYTVLLGIILAVSVATLTLVGGYAADIWVVMSGVMQAACSAAGGATC